MNAEQERTLDYYRHRYRELQTREARDDLFDYCRWLNVYVLRRVPA